MDMLEVSEELLLASFSHCISEDIGNKNGEPRRGSFIFPSKMTLWIKRRFFLVNHLQNTHNLVPNVPNWYTEYRVCLEAVLYIILVLEPLIFVGVPDIHHFVFYEGVAHYTSVLSYPYDIVNPEYGPAEEVIVDLVIEEDRGGLALHELACGGYYLV